MWSDIAEYNEAIIWTLLVLMQPEMYSTFFSSSITLCSY